MVNESTIYRPDTEHTKSMDSTIERFYPSNGTTFLKSSPFIEIPITVRKNGFLVPNETTLSLTWEAQPEADPTTANNFAIYASSAGSHALINRVTLHQGSNELECVSDWNRLHANMKVLYEDPYQANGNGSARDPALSAPAKEDYSTGNYNEDVLDESSKRGGIYPQCRTVGINLNLDANGNTQAIGGANPPGVTTEGTKKYSNKIKACLSLSALDLLGSSAQKLLPLSVANDFRLRIHLEKDVYKCYHALQPRVTAAGGTYPPTGKSPAMPETSGYRITDVSLNTKVISYDDEMWDKMLKSVKAKAVQGKGCSSNSGGADGSNILKWNGVQMRTSNVNTTYDSYFQEIVPNSQWTNLQSAIVFPYLPLLSANGDNLAECWGNGIYQAQFAVDGVQFPQLPVGEGDSNNPATSLSQLVFSADNCVRDSCRSGNGNSMIYSSMYPLPIDNTTAFDFSTTSVLDQRILPAGTSNCNEFVNLPPTKFPTNSQVNDFPMPPTSTTIGHGARTGRSSYFCAYGFNFTSVEDGKLVQGVDTRGRQCNLQVRQSMNATGLPSGQTAPGVSGNPAALVCMAVAVQYELDLNVGLLSVRLQ